MNCEHEWEQVWLDPSTQPPKLVGPFRCRKCRIAAPSAVGEAQQDTSDPVFALVAQWRQEAQELDEATRGQYVEPRVLLNCADELSAALAARQGEASDLAGRLRLILERYPDARLIVPTLFEELAALADRLRAAQRPEEE